MSDSSFSELKEQASRYLAKYGDILERFHTPLAAARKKDQVRSILLDMHSMIQDSKPPAPEDAGAKGGGVSAPSITPGTPGQVSGLADRRGRTYTQAPASSEQVGQHVTKQMDKIAKVSATGGNLPDETVANYYAQFGPLGNTTTSDPERFVEAGLGSLRKGRSPGAAITSPMGAVRLEMGASSYNAGRAPYNSLEAITPYQTPFNPMSRRASRTRSLADYNMYMVGGPPNAGPTAPRLPGEAINYERKRSEFAGGLYESAAERRSEVINGQDVGGKGGSGMPLGI